MKLVYMSVDNTDSDCRGNEPIYQDGKIVGLTTSGGYGYATGKSLAFAYVDPALTAPGTAFDVLVYNELRKARIIPEPAWDPRNERLKA
jgi:dimethylglycine dehydrogenase